MNQSASIKELATALCAFQGAVETIRKTATNPFFKSKYADLADILEGIRQPLVDNGLSFVQFPKGKYGLETMLMHVSGEYLSESYEMAPSRNDPQGAGAVITYQRRYALGAILGLNIDIDTDGEEDKLTVNQLGWAEELVRKSTLDEEKKERIYSELARQDLTTAEFTAITNKLKDAQPKKY
jgi:hypothetical protein